MSLRTTPKIDCHCHVFDPHRFPYDPASPYHPAGQEIGTAAQLARVFSANGVEHALLVQPNSGYDKDNACLLDAIASSRGRWKGIAVVRPDASLEELLALKAQGIVGIAINLTFYSRGHYADHAPLFARVAQADLWLQVQVEQDLLLDVLPMLEDCGARLLFDHCGRPDPAAGLDQTGFRALLALGQSGRAAVKLSGHVKFSNEAYPFADTHPYVRALIEAFGTESCVWGSDWPFLRAPTRIDYGPLPELLADIVQDSRDQQAILWDNPRRLFGF